jgi:hypothetical protein
MRNVFCTVDACNDILRDGGLGGMNKPGVSWVMMNQGKVCKHRQMQAAIKYIKVRQILCEMVKGLS